MKPHQVLMLSLIALTTTLIGAGLFAWTQHLSPFVGFYWAITTVTTVGYGDVTPHNTIGRIIAMATMVTTIPIAAAAFGGWTANLTSLHIRRALGMTLENHQDHIVILGYTSLLTHLLPDLIEEHQKVLLIAVQDPSNIPSDVSFIAGDPTNPHTLTKAHLTQARQIIVLGDTDGAVIMTAVEARNVAPSIPLFAITQSRRATQTLKELGMPHSVAAQDLLGHTLAKSLETPHAADLFVSLLTSDHTALQEIPVTEEWIGKTFNDMRHHSETIALGIVHNNQVFLGVNENPVMTAEDHILWLIPSA